MGFNSGQVEDPARGFSFLHDGPLDMRYDPSTGVTAADLLNYLDSPSLAAIFVEYSGESLRTCRHLANAICKRRSVKPFTSTVDFANLVNSILGGVKPYRKTPCTTIFQALRIAVNDEFAQLDSLMETLPEILEEGGVAVFLCFHSLEMKCIKRWMRMILGGGKRVNSVIGNKWNYMEGRDLNLVTKTKLNHMEGREINSITNTKLNHMERDLNSITDINNHSKQIKSIPSFTILTPKPILPSTEEISTNHRVRSTMLYAIQKNVP